MSTNDLKDMENRLARLEVVVRALLEVTQTGGLNHRLAALQVLNSARESTPSAIIEQAERLFGERLNEPLS